MPWELNEALTYYKKQGAPREQGALLQLLQEVQEEWGGRVPEALLPRLAQDLGVKESYLSAFIRRMPRLRLGEGHLLELCAGPNCGKALALAREAEALAGGSVTVRYVPCMRLCAKGPNLRLDGKLCQGMTPEKLRQLLKPEEKSC